MAEIKTTYLRLPGTRSPFLNYSLWVAEDHIMSRCAGPFSETYHRFYFRDIQALVLSRTDHLGLRNRALFGVAIFWFFVEVLIGLSMGAGLLAWVLLTVPTAALLVAALINTLQGPTCLCKVVTRVQTQSLPSLSRRGVAKQVFDALQTAVEHAQHPLSREEALARLLRLAREPRPGGPGAQPAVTTKILRPDKARFHEIVFWLLGLDALLSALHIFYADALTNTVASVHFLAVAACAVAGIITQRDTSIPSSLRNVLWVVLGYLVFSFLAVNVVNVMLQLENPQPFGLLIRSGLEEPAVLVLDLFFIVVSGILATAGLAMVYSYRRRLTAEAQPRHESSPETPSAGAEE